ncbi:sensor histidine kinase [Chitinophaga rhizophila]|uniref:Histidine kinase n=1 Tax=Chitinophaga rhizophila TaxID=2866212 RepID=A0ABS7GDD3_9BACT|nr:histidine kinase [Chitinophaga rhizophila]MBW8685688.1 histidine kinase [Chitinophaga rhizophila]
MAASNYKFLRLYGYPIFCLLTNLIFFLINPYERTFNAWRQFTVLDFFINTLISLLFPLAVIETGIWLTYLLNKRLHWKRNMKTRFIVQLIVHMGIVLLILNLFFLIPFPDKFAFNQLLYRQSSITGMIFCLVITSIFAAEYLVFRLNNARIEAAKLNELAVQAQLDALKLQLDPHFLFNNLSTLTSLIEENQSLSVNYVVKLSSIYRYMMNNRTQNTIAVAVELDFIKNILFLHQTRYGQAIQVNIAAAVEDLQGEIAPLTLQLLIENAIKHNQFSGDAPLTINIYLEENTWLVVRNNKKPKRTKEPGAQLGLKNITQRYVLLCGQKPLIDDGPDYFEVKIPLLKTNTKDDVKHIDY